MTVIEVADLLRISRTYRLIEQEGYAAIQPGEIRRFREGADGAFLKDAAPRLAR